MYSQIFRYIRKVCFLSIPFFLFVALYIYLDPLKVIGHYDNYYQNDARAHFSINQGYVSISNYDNHYPEYEWDSFIFGNSRSRYWPIQDWMNYLPTGSKGYHMEAHSETLLGMLGKIEYINKQAHPLKNALLIIDSTILANTESRDDYLFCIAPQLEDNSHWLAFHTRHFVSFCDKQFLESYLFHTFFKTSKVPSNIIHLESFDYDYTKNEISYDEYEQQISKGTYYTDELVKHFFGGEQYPDSLEKPTIKAKQVSMLRNIKKIFDKQGTNYKIVINPVYNQIRISPQDIAKLNEIFGEEYVFDFSGKNRFTSDYHNYYEFSHYRPIVSRQILDSIYKTF